MERLNDDRFNPDISTRLRQERDLIEQLRSDYREVNRLKERLRKGRAGREEKEKLAKLQSWIRTESRLLKETDGEIEGIICADLNRLKR